MNQPKKCEHGVNYCACPYREDLPNSSRITPESDQPTESWERVKEISLKPWAMLLGRWMSENIETYDPESEKALLLALDENISFLIETTRKEERKRAALIVERVVEQKFDEAIKKINEI